MIGLCQLIRTNPRVLLNESLSLLLLPYDLLENCRLQSICKVVRMLQLAARFSETFLMKDQLDPFVELFRRDLLKSVVINGGFGRLVVTCSCISVVLLRCIFDGAFKE